jgi:aminopeptidase N
MDLTIDFKARAINGLMTLDVERSPTCNPGTRLTLDTRELLIEQVQVPAPGSAWTATDYEMGPRDAILGRPLLISLPDRVDRVRIAYRTTPDAEALQWLDPAQTSSGRYPFLYTQSAATRARTWLPLQDTPAVRQTLTATIRVPAGLRAVMGADFVSDSNNVFRFRMEQTIPSYLISLAVGEIAFGSTGPRTGVFAERTVVDRACVEFADVERMLQAAELIVGPYRWNRYDLLVLPPSFPLGGMENPKLTFTTPTIITGDRSLVPLVAHELSHAWSGTLVTMGTWSDFWLSEGFATYLERRIVEALYGRERAEMDAVLGLQDLREELARVPQEQQILAIGLAMRNPDEGGTGIPYEKGALFLATLERVVGRAEFDAFLRSYFDRYAFKSVTTAEFEAYVRERLFRAGTVATGGIDLHAWLHEPGLPRGIAEPRSVRLEAAQAVARRWSSGEIDSNQLDARDWTTPEWIQFLRALPATVPCARIADLDAAYNLTGRENLEIAVPWLRQGIRNSYGPASQRAEKVLLSTGRRRFLVPLYQELVKTPTGRATALAIYAKARPLYHPIVIERLDRVFAQ